MALHGEGLAELEVRLHHVFARPELLELALTHRSLVYDRAGSVADSSASDARHDNEQMEFLGDAVLGLLAAEAFCDRFPATREGELTRLRAAVVSRKHLGEMGRRLELGRWLRVGRTVELTNGRNSASLLSNAMEAIIAAIYLDGGLGAARAFVEREVLAPALPALENSLAGGGTFNGAVGDFKSALQERVQGEGLGQPEYRVLEESGPAHNLAFRVQVLVAGKACGDAWAPSKKQAQQEAARLALARLEGHDERNGNPS